MSDTSEGWDDQKSEDLSLEGIPKSWAGFSRAKKVEHLVSVIQVQLQKVRTGTFNHVKGERVAALALEGLLFHTLRLEHLYQELRKRMVLKTHLRFFGQSNIRHL